MRRRLQRWLCDRFGHPGYVSQTMTARGGTGYVQWTQPVCARCRRPEPRYGW